MNFIQNSTELNQEKSPKYREVFKNKHRIKVWGQFQLGFRG